MTLEEAKKLLDEQYEKAQKLAYVTKPLAFALYRVWKKADDEEETRLSTDLSNKCGSCRWSVPCQFNTRSTSGCYVECQNPNKIWRHQSSMMRQRTTPKCKLYERRENEQD